MEANVEIAGKSFTLQSDDAYLEAVGPVFEPEMVALFRCFAQGTVLDIGANIGCTALALSSMADVVHAFEPSPSTFRLLRTNTSVAPNIVLHNYGLGAEKGAFELTFAPNNRSGGYVSNQLRASEGHTVESIAIDELDNVAGLLNLDAIDFIKIDVEGFEGSVIKGGTRTLKKFRPVVALELNHWCLNAFQRITVPDFLDSLRATFPILYAVHDDTYQDLHDSDESYIVMHRHIVMMKYPTLVGAFHPNQMARFHEHFRHEAVA
ncbi:FkbM family methyltransferase [Dyella sp. BiH032]|uniref:FkbM family methyltransferase n=1 Tax=Dyella sp. BiH032 TaxID=3075430 RepID=UPI002892C37C|nr:FkbM family methyltransferase [Dyella sp. BiH032]WNL45632.1 FkbM family methyltransferase [Dyella sp. BiH032]